MRLYGKQWPNDFRKRFFIGMHMLDRDQNSYLENALSKFDPKEFVGSFADTGCDAVYFYMSCHIGNCFYPTKVNPGRTFSYMRGRDFFGEVAAECAKREIALVAVYEFMNLQFIHFHEKYPCDWHHYRKDSEGKPLVRPCWNGGYGDFVREQINEVAATYPVAGFYLDMFDYPGRELCPNCIARYRDEFGREPPDFSTDYADPNFKDYKLWTFREAVRYLNKVQADVQKKIPGVTVVNNYHHMICEDLYDIREAVSYVSTDPTIGYASRFNEGFSRPTKTPIVFRSLSEGKNSDFDILYDNIIFGVLQVLPLEPSLAVCASALAQGGWPCPASMWALDGTLNPAALGLVKNIFAHVDKAAPWIGDWRSLKGAGVYLSQESQFMRAAPGDKWDKSEHDYMTGFYGTLMALEYAHVPIDVLTRRQLSRLDAYPIVYLSNAACLSEMETEAFREYVRNGGTLVASYRASLYDEWGYPLENFRLADVFGVNYDGAKLESYMAFQVEFLHPEKVTFEPWENPSITVRRQAIKVRLRDGAREVAVLRERYGPSDRIGELPAIRNAFVKPETTGPAIIENHFGKGRCVYFAVDPAKAFARTLTPETRKLLTAWTVGDALAACPIRLPGAPGCVKLSAFERPALGQWIAHLVNIQANPGDQHDPRCIPAAEYILPVHDLTLEVKTDNREIRRIFLPLSGEELTPELVDGRVQVRIPKVHVHQIVVIVFSESWVASPERVSEHDPLKKGHCPGPLVKTAPEKRFSWNFDDHWNGLGEGQTAPP